MVEIGEWCGKCPFCKKMTQYFIFNYPNGKWWCKTCKKVWRPGDRNGLDPWKDPEGWAKREPWDVPVGKYNEEVEDVD